MTPRKFLRSIVIFNLVLIIFSVVLGLSKTGNPSRYFGERRYTTFISAAQLLSIGAFAWFTFQQRHRSLALPGAAKGFLRSPHYVWALIAAGFAFLAVDEIAELHERMDRLIIKTLNLPKNPLTARIDDAILGSYGLIGLVVLWVCRKEILRFWKVMKGPLVAGFVCLFLGVLCDTAAHDDHFFFWLTGDLPLSKKLNSWFSVFEGALTLLPEALFLGAFYAAWRQSQEESLPVEARA